MSACRLSGIFCKYLRDRFRLLNVFDSRSTDQKIVYGEIVSTRVFLVLLLISIVILTMYTSLSLQFSTYILELPTHGTYEKLLEKHSDSVHCPCRRISVSYGQFIRLQPTFHQVCSSGLISQEWIDFTFAANLTVIWPMDVRTSLSAMWQLLSALCQSSIRILIDNLDGFKNSPLISSILLSEKLLKTKVQTALKTLEETAADSFMRPLIVASRLTEVNGLMSGLAMNYVPFMPSSYGGPQVKAQGTQYIRQGDTTVCHCNQAGSCPIPGNIYLYNMWETNSTYDLNMIVANETVPGIIVDCWPIQMTLASSLECFYNQTCFRTLLSAYPRTISIAILDKTVPSRFSLTDITENLSRRLFLEGILNETIYQLYYDECSPIHCSYSYAHRFNWIYVLTTLVALFGGLNMTFRLLAPSLVAFVFYLNDIRQRPRQPKIEQNQSKIFPMNVYERHQGFNHLRCVNTYHYNEIIVKIEGSHH